MVFCANELIRKCQIEQLSKLEEQNAKANQEYEDAVADTGKGVTGNSENAGPNDDKNF